MRVRYRLKVAFQFIVLAVAVALCMATSFTDEFSPVYCVYEYDPAADTWTKKAPFRRSRIAPVCGQCAGNIYVVGGRSGMYGERPRAYADRFDIAGDEWSSIRAVKLPAEQRYSAHCSIGDKLYIMGCYYEGHRGYVYLPSLLEYDTVSDTWTRMADMPSVGPNARCFVIGSDIYYAAPCAWLGRFPIMHKYDTLTDTWTVCAEPPAPGLAVDVGGTIYIVGGTDSVTGAPLDSVYEYDAAGDTWLARASKPTTLYPWLMAAVGGRLYVFYDKGMPVEEYDIGSDSWALKSDIPIHFISYLSQCGRGFAVGGRIYLFSPTGEVQEYDPAADTWTEKAHFPGPACVTTRRAFSGTNKWYHENAGWVLVNDRIYVVGGHVRYNW
jgi:N-acetylneuraminic acid mutarotase